MGPPQPGFSARRSRRDPAARAVLIVRGSSPRRPAASLEEVRRAVAALDREARARLLAGLTGRFGDLDLAEDSLQDAIAQALATWPRTGLPDSPGAWLATTAKRKALDVVRREGVLTGKLARLEVVTRGEPVPTEFADPAIRETPEIDDELLGMFFACTHEVLSPEDRIALTLRFVAGLSTAEVAHALLTPVPTVQQRIVRAKRRIRTLGVPFTVPAAADLPSRAAGVLRVVYLLYSEGFARSTGPSHVRDDLTAEGLRLCRLLHAPAADSRDDRATGPARAHRSAKAGAARRSRPPRAVVAAGSQSVGPGPDD
ncbi:sigma-70 family RNA polymerase sigma factor [Gordonia neofelifaecis NRRL B-59395]|uniref:Sigma-70 family RNA polymerase sigma factor n=1 Tax=Gordonia neofelifaecis NRRL B-59395 TaxID=644548 RepID=F1YI01_9ACTN|nr:sigma-70 family RNA polymerase sigma factor [Gordonia neofelifaecis NRRL B-59395]